MASAPPEEKKSRHSNPGNRTKNRGVKGVLGITPQIQRQVVRAATMFANGRTYREIAIAVNASQLNVKDWRFTHKAIWQGAYDVAMERVRETVRKLAGKPAVLDDVDGFLLAAARTDDWSRERGEELFENGGLLTLPKFYEDHYKPMRPSSRGDQYRNEIILRRWSLITGDPPLEKIDKFHLALFRDALSKSRGIRRVGYMSPTTVRHYMAQVQAILDKAGPSCWRNRDAMDIIAKVPWAKPPRKLRRPVRIASEEVLGNFYVGCIAADRPESPDFKPAAWWRALVVFLYNTGLRRGSMTAIRMSWINWERRYIEIPAEKTKTGMGQIIPLNETTIEHLQAIRGEREFLFDFGAPIDRYFYTYFHKLQDECGIPREEHFGLHTLRKTCATVMWEHSPAAAQFALGHTSMETTAGYYVKGQAMLRRAAEQMPQPSAFGNGIDGNGAAAIAEAGGKDGITP